MTTGAMLDTGWYSLEMCMLQIWHTVLNDAWFSKTKQPTPSQNLRELALSMCVWACKRRVTEVTITNQNPLTHCSGGALRIGVTISIHLFTIYRVVSFFHVVRVGELEELSEIG